VTAEIEIKNNRIMDKLLIWCLENGLEINTKKTIAMLFHTGLRKVS
jgi:hypothetical protein